ncbi:hypothetical protein SAMN06297251_10930 [Fulvimarina manganoxydans]|uniref:LPS-assembly lipoprotein n=1 Tax=Fulvimarina manganoxydans TaxID=937218 RepID=A0A1W2CA90_9HYPH|nr:hypothetical protein [Fulvimarina manganoxydans]SMC81608.1 hypothetical protein SAMN06297251_10930 [Fulvimarina manganoxydans]
MSWSRAPGENVETGLSAARCFGKTSGTNRHRRRLGVWSDGAARLGLILALSLSAASLAGCTAGPLYGGVAPDGQSAETLRDLRGRIAVSEANTRTAQIVRNPLLLRLNAGAPVSDPVYEVRLTVNGAERGISIESTGVPVSAIYVLTVNYQLVRLSDNQVVDSGMRQVPVPFDRTAQLFQSQRALLNAREQAGKEAAAQLELAIATALQRAG